jgi:hypothetical protein
MHLCPSTREDIGEWFNDIFAQISQSRASAAASFFEINKQNVIGLLKLALRAKDAGKVSKTGAQVSQADQEKQLEEIMAAMERSTELWKRQNLTEDDPAQPIDSVEPAPDLQSPAAAQEITAEIDTNDIFSSATQELLI